VRTRAQGMELADQKARMESQLLLLKMQLIEQMSKTEKKKRECLERVGIIKRECDLRDELEDGEIVQPIKQR
jgi:hypothetical protein